MPKNGRLEECLSNQSKYCYDGTEILVNNFNILNQEQLETVERRISALMLTKIQIQDVPSFKEVFNIDYLCRLHKEVFCKIYTFDGEIRRENIYKGHAPFCRPEFIASNLIMLLEKIKEDIKKIKSRDDIIYFLAYYYSEINVIHPFREGNGRITREYLRQVVVLIDRLYELDYDLDFSNVDEKDKSNLMNGSIVSAMNGDLTLLKAFFDSRLKDMCIDYSFKR